MVVGDVNGGKAEDKEAKNAHGDEPVGIQTQPCKVEGNRFTKVEPREDDKEWWLM